MATLTGKKIKNTYDALIKIEDNNTVSSTAKQLTDGLGNSTPLYLSSTQLGIGVTPSFQLHTSSSAKIGGDLTVTGNLTVDGTTTIIDSTIIAVGDNMIELAKDNVANIKDIGWYGTIVESGTKYVGAYYDASSGVTTPTFYIGLGINEPGSTAAWTVKGKLVIGAIDSTGGTFSGQITIPEAPTADAHAASKKYVDDSVSSLVDGDGTTNDVVMWEDENTLTDAPIAINGNNATFAGNIITNTGILDLSIGGTNIGIEVKSNDDGSYIRFDDGVAANRWYAGVNSGDFGIYNNDNEKPFEIDSNNDATFTNHVTVNERIQVGTNTSGDSSIISQTGDIQLRIGSNALEHSPYIRLQGNNGTSSVYGDVKLDVTNQKLVFNDPGTSSGNIGTNPMTLDNGGNLEVGGDVTVGGDLDVTRNSSGQILSRVWNQNTSGTGTSVFRIANNGNQENGTRIEFSDLNYYNAAISADRTNGIRFMVHDDSTNMTDLLTHTALRLSNNKSATFSGNIYGNLIQLQGYGFKGGEGDILDSSTFGKSGIGNTFRWVEQNSASAGSTWQKVCDVTLNTTFFDGVQMEVVVYQPNTNWGDSASFIKNYYSVAFRGSQSDVGPFHEDAIVYGINADLLRVYKVSTNNYELQARSSDDNRDLVVEYTITSKNNAKVTPNDSHTDGTTSGGTAYTASANSNTKTKFAGEVEFQGTTIGDDLRVNGFLFLGAGADSTYGGYLTNKGVSAEGISMKVHEDDGFDIYQVWGNAGEAALSFEAVDSQVKLYYSGTKQLETYISGTKFYNKVLIDANGTANTVEVWDDSTTGQPGFMVTNTGNQSTSTHTLYLKNYNSGVSDTLFGTSIASKSIVASSDGGEGLLFGTIVDKPIWIGTNNSLVMKIDNDSRVQINGTSSQPFSSLFHGTLVINGGTNEDPIIAITDSASNNAIAILAHQSSTSAGVPSLRVQTATSGTGSHIFEVLHGVSNTTGAGGTTVLAVDSSGLTEIIGTAKITGTADGLLTLDQDDTGNWSYINFQNQGTRKYYIGTDAELDFRLGADVANSKFQISNFSDVDFSVARLHVLDLKVESGGTNSIRIGDGYGSGGTATIHNYDNDLYLQYNNNLSSTFVRFGGGGSATDIIDAQNDMYRINSTDTQNYFKRTTQFHSNVYVNQTGNLTNQALQVNGFIDITNVNGKALRWYNGTTFRGGLGTDDWASSGTAADLTMYVSGTNAFHTMVNNTKITKVHESGLDVLSSTARITLDGSSHSGLQVFSPSNAHVNIDSRNYGTDGAALHKYNRNSANNGYRAYYERWYDGNSYHDIGVSSDKFRMSDGLVITGDLTVTDFVRSTGGNLKFDAGGTHVLNIDLNRKIYPNTHNSTDLGFSSSLAFRHLYLSGDINAGGSLVVNGTGKFYSAIGTADDVRTGLAHYDTTSQAAGVGGQIVLGYKYISDTTYTEGAILKMYKENSTSGHYGSGLKFQVRNNGASLSTKMFLNPSGSLVFNKPTGTYNSGGFGDPKIVVKQTSNSDWGGLNIEANGNDSVFSFSNNDSEHVIAGSYRATAGYKDIVIQTSGTAERIRFTAGGYIGINRTSPDSLLHIDQTSNNRAGGLYIERNGSSYGLSAFVDTGGYGIIGGNGTYPNDVLTMDFNNAYLGLGTQPTNRLHTYSSDNEGIYMQGTGGGHWFNFKAGSSNLWSMGAQTGLMGWYNRTSPNVGYKMVIEDAGDVGIGLTGPAYRLHVNGESQIHAVNFETGAYPGIRFRSSSASSTNIWKWGVATPNANAFYLYDYTKGSSIFWFVPNGNAYLYPTANVGIGYSETQTLSYKLDLTGGSARLNGVRAGQDWHIANRGGIRIDSKGTSYPSDLLFGHTAAANQSSWTGVYWSISSRAAADNNTLHFYRGGGNPTETSEHVVMTLHPLERVGINDTTPSYALDVTGDIRATADVIAFSDARVKENVETIDSALDKVNKLRGVSYNRNDIEDKSKKIGVIAQEVLEVLPEVVQLDDNDRYSVAYGNMAGLFIEAIKELKGEIEELKKCNCK